MKRVNNLNLSFRRYFYFLFKAIVSPRQYSLFFSNYLSWKDAFSFFLINLFWALVILTLVKNLSGSINLIFSFVSQIIFFVPFGVLLLFLLTTVLHILSKALGASKDFKSSFLAVCYSSLLLFFLPIKYLQIIGIIYSLFLLIYNFKNFQTLSFIKATLTIIFPTLMVILFLLMIGIINPLNL